MKTTCAKSDLLPFEQLLADGLKGDLQREVENHLSDCSICQRKLQKMAAAQDQWDKVHQHLLDSQDLEPEEWMVNQQTIEIKLAEDTESDEPAHAAGETSYYDRLALDAPTHPELLGRIDEFEIEKVIGRGGCGVVYKAFDRELNRPVAIKVLAPHLASNGIARQRFAREARAAAAVVHPNVVPIHSVSSGPERPYIVMSLVHGRSLEAHVREHGPLELKDIVRIAQQIAAGLSAAHRQGLIHRDIKPANILLEQDVSRVMITDFGLARAADDAAITQTGWLAGTPHYMSPEQSRGNDLDQRSDLFSLGSVIYFMATGREPFRAEKPFAVIQKIITEAAPRPRRINADISPTLEQVIERLLSKDPKNRFQTAADVQTTLEQYLAHLQNPLASPKPRGIYPTRSRRISQLVGVVLALSVFALPIWWFVQSGRTNTATNDAVAEQERQTEINSIVLPEMMPDSDLNNEIQLVGEELTRIEASLAEFDRQFAQPPEDPPPVSDQNASESDATSADHGELDIPKD